MAELLIYRFYDVRSCMMSRGDTHAFFPVGLATGKLLVSLKA